MILQAAADAVAVGTHHAGSQFVEDLERRLVNRKAELPLKLNRRDTGSIRGNKVCAPKPDRQRRVGILHDGPRRQPVVALALATPQDMWSLGEAIRFTRLAAPATHEPVAPADRL
jgi:hypothetical protein